MFGSQISFQIIKYYSHVVLMTCHEALVDASLLLWLITLVATPSMISSNEQEEIVDKLRTPR